MNRRKDGQCSVADCVNFIPNIITDFFLFVFVRKISEKVSIVGFIFMCPSLEFQTNQVSIDHRTHTYITYS